MTHVFALGELLGWPGAAELVAHGLDSLRHDFRDPAHGGWFAQVGGADDKRAYEHVFVVLAAACVAATTSCSARRWRCSTRTSGTSDAGALRRRLEPRLDASSRRYRGANANMHGVEAMVADRGPAVARAGGAGHASGSSSRTTRA